MQEAIESGILTGIINSGNIVEPGTGVFVASSESRKNHDEISKKIIQSGADIILSGGEEYLLPIGVEGKFCTGRREDGLNLIEWAKKNNYTVVFSSDELKNAVENSEKILGVFAADATFNAVTEEEQKELNLKNFNENSPTLAEMTEAALDFFEKKGKQFFLVVEEEGTDNFGNHTNANGMLEALKRADDAIGVASSFVKKHKNTMLLTAADSEAGGMEVLNHTSLKADQKIPERDRTGSEYDGRDGTGSLPFLAMPDKFGNRYPFVAAWSTSYDVTGAVVARAEGINSHLMTGNIENTDIYRFMYATLFGVLLDK